MSITQSTVDEIKSLSVSEKILIVEEIWDSILVQCQYPDLTKEQESILNERIDSYHANPTQGRTWDELKSEFWNAAE